MYESQIIMLYTLNLNTAVCQLYHNKTGKIKVKYTMEQKQNLRKLLEYFQAQ